MDAEVGKYCSKIPMELTDGKGGMVFYPDDFFLNLDAPENFLFHDKKWVAWIRVHFFNIRIVTTAGKKPKVKVAREVRKILWKQYNEIQRT